MVAFEQAICAAAWLQWVDAGVRYKRLIHPGESPSFSLQRPLSGCRRSTGWPKHLQGVYQTGDDQARSLIVFGSSFGCGTLSFIASYMLQRHTGFWITRT